MLAAEIQFDTLGRAFLFAVVAVSPYAIFKVRQVRALRRELAAQVAAATAPPPPSRPQLEDIIDRISELAGGGTADRSVTVATITVPNDVTVAGDDPPPGLVDTLVRDALRRSGLVTTAEIDTPEGRVIEFRPAAH